jgi:anti-anti-sigma factor
MLEVTRDEKGEIALSGRFDALQVEKVKPVLDQITTSAIINFKELEYISSAGLGTLLATQKRLMGSGHALTLVNLNSYVLNVFKYAGFDTIFKIE